MNKRLVGSFWEAQASLYLSNKGFIVLHKNWTCRWGEIDLIAKDKDTLVFIEVKYRTTTAFGEPWEAVGTRKRFNQLGAIKHFLAVNNCTESPWRFDVVSITKEPRFLVRHFEFVPLPLQR